MLGLITDRTWSNLMRLEELSSKQWGDMTASEQAEWMGDPFTAVGYGAVNLMPNGPHVSHGADLVYRNQYLRATANSADVGLYATVVIGDAQHFEDKSITLSVDEIQSDGGVPRVALYWHDENGDDYAGVALSKAGSVTATLSKNVSMRPQLAMCIWATTTTKMNIGDSTTYTGLMLELGTERHTYVPYTEIVATPATKGA